MKIHSDIIEYTDLARATIEPTRIKDVYVEAQRVGSRKRGHGFNVTLYSTDETRPHKNSGKYGADTGNYNKSVSWDDWGIWMDRLFELDPNAIIGIYDGRDDFYRQTWRVRAYIREEYKPHTKRYKEHMAPWLEV